jgi:tetratricopeptide (TPR) repeat protein
VLEYARAVASAVRAAGGGDVNENLRIAMGLFQSLELSGLTYARDPSTPYEDAVKNKAAIDRLRFPGQTLVDKAGDRDELSILYSALLEAAGIETAFVTVPGRIFIAFSAGLEPDDAKDSFSTTGDLIFLEGKTWVPVEITTIGEGFLAAWKTGAGEWRDSSRDSAARFHPVHAAWTVYPPAGLVSSGAAGAPNNDAVTGAYSRELAKFVNREIAAVEGKLKDEVLRSRNDPGPANRLGVLYARYGLYEKAAAEFEKIVAGREFIPAIVNLGNIHYVKKEWKEALAMYGRAYMENKNEATVILSIAKVMYEMKDLQAAEEYYSVLETKDRFLARKYSYIVTEATDDEGRAAVNELAARAVWME